jgi:hypothetical protein
MLRAWWTLACRSNRARVAPTPGFFILLESGSPDHILLEDDTDILLETAP